MFLMTPTLLPGAVGTHIRLCSNGFKLPERQHIPMQTEAEVMQIWEASSDLELCRI